MLDSSTSDTSALVVRGSSSSNQGKKKKKKKPKCEHCRKMGHTKGKCRDLHGKPRNCKPKQRRGTAAATSTKDQCSIPRATPSLRNNWRLSKNTLTQANLSQNSVIGTSSLAEKGHSLNDFATPKQKSGSWIVESSVSDHMTGDASILQNFTNCSEEFFVRIANGSL